MTISRDLMLMRPEDWTSPSWLRILIPMNGNDLWPTEDPLGEALHSLRMDGTFYCRSELTAPWGLALPPVHGCLWFHVVTSGRCWLEVEGAEPRWLQPGDLALVPHGEGHRLRSDPGAPTPIIHALYREQVSGRYEILRHGAGGDATNLVCGAVTFDHPAGHNLVKLLPRIMHIEASRSPQTDWMQSILRLMAAEARDLRPGGETVITRLSDILIIQAIRSWIETDPAAQTGWLGALQDRQIGRALSLIHRDPARAWSVASLADEIAMSRSAFAARFTELVGEPAMHYVTRWRMQVARNWLTGDDAAVGELASRLGYQSEAAFSRAFKRVIGVAPGTVRRNGNAANFERPARESHRTGDPGVHRSIVYPAADDTGFNGRPHGETLIPKSRTLKRKNRIVRAACWP